MVDLKKYLNKKSTMLAHYSEGCNLLVTLFHGTPENIAAFMHEHPNTKQIIFSKYIAICGICTTTLCVVFGANCYVVQIGADLFGEISIATLYQKLSKLSVVGHAVDHQVLVQVIANF